VSVVQASPTQAPPQATQSSSSNQQEATPTNQTSAESTQNSAESSPTATATASQPGQETQTESTTTQAAPAATATPSASTGTTNAQTDGACSEKAAFYGDVTIPDKTPFQQGESFVKIWKIRNEGTCDWGTGYSLVFAGGDIMNGPASQPLPAATVGETVEITVDLTAPMSGGVFTGNWEFEDPQGQRFGVGAGGHGYIWAQISVNWIDGQAATEPGGGSSSSSTVSASTSSTCPVETNAAYESQVLALINQARADQGVAPLTSQNQLAQAALVHSTDMACQDYVDHIGSDGSRYYDRILAQGYSYAAASENIYVGDPAFGGTPEGAFEWWMNSDIHRRTILNPKYTQAGVAYVYRAGSTYGGYYTVEFAVPK
jgi:uncharacterized protein YkwD